MAPDLQSVRARAMQVKTIPAWTGSLLGQFPMGLFAHHDRDGVVQACIPTSPSATRPGSYDPVDDGVDRPT